MHFALHINAKLQLDFATLTLQMILHILSLGNFKAVNQKNTNSLELAQIVQRWQKGNVNHAECRAANSFVEPQRLQCEYVWDI